MKEVKSPKKPLIYYYSIILLIVLLFNLIVSPLLMKNQVTEVDYGTFMRMIEEKNIGEVEVEDDEILFTDKDKQQVYTTGAMDDPTLTQRLYDSGATFTKEIQKTMSPVLSFVLTAVLPLVIFIAIGQYMGKKLVESAGGKNSLMFGGTGALIGGFDPFIQGDYSHLGLDIPLWVYIVFQTVFCATAATIVSGSMAERTNFKAYCVYSAAISLVVYPICGHWMWGGGWLQSMGFHDFAGSAAVHNVGGVIALLGAWMLGPRIGKYDKDGNPHAIPGHNLTAGALGVFILWFCWFGFNGGSSLSLSTDATMTLTGLVCFNTNLAAAVATCVTMIFTWLRYGKPDVSMTLNGSLAGLVAITAGCDTVSPFGAFFIGFVAGILVVLSVEFFDKIAKVDDPVGAVSVHFANGVWGTIAVGLFSTGSNTAHAGLFYGGGLAQLGTQLLGLVCVDVYVVIVMFIIFKIIDKTLGLRVPAEVEIDGLDIHEHGLASAYAGFAISDANSAAMTPNENTDLGEDDITKATAKQMDAAVPVVREPVIHDGVYDTGMHKVSIIAKLAKFDQLKTALNDLGVTGMTVTQVMGCGIQKGTPEKYRGVPVDTTLLPKIKVEVIVSRISVDAVVEAAKKALYTGHIGDGKIFVYNVTRVVKIRTGEEDYAALQDVE